jgi:hypothetical protein
MHHLTSTTVVELADFVGGRSGLAAPEKGATSRAIRAGGEQHRADTRVVAGQSLTNAADPERGQDCPMGNVSAPSPM